MSEDPDYCPCLSSIDFADLHPNLAGGNYETLPRQIQVDFQIIINLEKLSIEWERRADFDEGIGKYKERSTPTPTFRTMRALMGRGKPTREFNLTG